MRLLQKVEMASFLYHFYLCSLQLQQPSFNGNGEVNAKVTIDEWKDKGTVLNGE